MEAGVFSISRTGRIRGVATSISTTQQMAVAVMQLPMVWDRLSRFLAPKYWDTMMPAPAEMPMNSTRSILTMGPQEPTAARALSPMYLPTTMESTVL